MFSWLLPQRIPLVVAHRGSSVHAPENTLVAFRQAIIDGADAIELDVHLTKDKQVVVIHDSTLDRTTNGSGKVEEYSLKELQRFSAGAWFHKKFSSETIPTIDEVFEVIPGQIGINIEIKAERNGSRNCEIVDRCCDIIQKHAALGHVMISSFSHAFVRHARKIQPKVATGLLYHPVKHFMKPPVQFAQSIGAEYLLLSRALVRKRLVDAAHIAGLRVGEYTIHTEHRVKRVMRYHIDVCFCDDPARVQKWIPPP